jgi:hypothetical protein
LKKLFLIILLCASVGLAQKGNKGGGGGGDNGGFGAAPMPNKFENIAITLNLNKDQRKAAKTILDDGAKEAAPLRDQISKSRIAVGEAIDAKKSDEELMPIARTSSDLSAQLTELELKTFGKIAATLDETQKKNMPALQRALILMNDIFHNKNWNE